MNILACIVTYNPDEERLKENVNAIYKQVDKIIFVDNGSEKTRILDKLSFIYYTAIIKNKENKGIAYALNQAMKYAYENGYEWVVTLDQDSVSPDKLVEKAIPVMTKDVSMVVPLIRESNSDEMCLLGTPVNDEKYQEVKKCITSAAITNVDIWKKIKGFNNKLFIDYVDYDYAMRTVLAGYRIIRMNEVILDHRIGNSVIRKFFWTEVRVGNHSEKRKYYIARNMVFYIRKYKENINVIEELLRLFKVFALIILYEEKKGQKLKAFFKGIRAGLAMEL